MKIEEKVKELENIIAEIEKVDINLDDAIEKFQKASLLAKAILEEIKTAEGKVSIIKKELGEVTEVPFDEE
ncbi:MAG: exodeoxyribonuclease VII small subunit [Clostridia bacterium]